MNTRTSTDNRMGNRTRLAVTAVLAVLALAVCAPASADDGGGVLGWLFGATLRQFASAKAASPGALSVDIQPEAARKAGAQWSTTGVPFRNTGTVSGLTPGDYTVTFSEVTGWTKPDDIVATVVNGERTTVVGTYVSLAPGAPEDVEASSGTFTDKVLVTWTAADDGNENVEFQVYRAQSSSTDDAQAISDWITATEYSDTTARAWVSGGGTKCLEVLNLGCNGNGDEPATTPTYYFYWVKARNQEGFVSEFSDPDVGHRGQQTKARVDAVPQALTEDGAYLAGPADTLALRLNAEAAIDPASVWGLAGVQGWDGPVEWLPVDAGQANDGWVLFEPDFPWPVGARIVLEAGAKTVDGGQIGPVREVFVISPRTDAKSGALLAEVDAGALPVALRGGVGSVYSIADAVFGEPQRVWVPVPAGHAADSLGLFFFVQDAQGGQWHGAEDVAGLLASGEAVVLEEDGTVYLGYEVRHGGIVQLAARSGSPSPAAVTSDFAGCALLIASVLALGTLRRLRRNS